MINGRTVSALPRHVPLARLIRAICLSNGSRDNALHIAEEWRDSPEVQLVLKSEVAPMDNQAASAGALASYGFSSQIIEAARGLSIIGTLRPRMTQVPFRTFYAKETAATGSAWVAEYGGMRAIPVVRFDLAQSSLAPCIVSSISVFSVELLRFASAAIDAGIVRSITSEHAKFLDSEFLDLTKGKLANERPGSITNLGLKFTSTGSTSAAIEADLEGMIALLTSWQDATWVMSPRLAAKLMELFAAPIGIKNILGIPVISSPNVPAEIVLLDVPRVILADDEIVGISIAKQASIVATTTPQSSPVASELVSLWQRNLSGVRVERRINWELAENSACITMAVTY